MQAALQMTMALSTCLATVAGATAQLVTIPLERQWPLDSRVPVQVALVSPFPFLFLEHDVSTSSRSFMCPSIPPRRPSGGQRTETINEWTILGRDIVIGRDPVGQGTVIGPATTFHADALIYDRRTFTVTCGFPPSATDTGLFDQPSNGGGDPATHDLGLRSIAAAIDFEDSTHYGWITLRAAGDMRFDLVSLTYDRRPWVPVTFGVAQSCPADLDGSRSLDILDLLMFFSLFTADDAAADVDGRAGLDVFDIMQYLRVFAAGC